MSPTTINRYISTNRTAFTQELAKWIQSPSLAGDEKPCQKIIKEAMESCGLIVKEETITEEIWKDENFVKR